jgi:hypothetical protein
MTKTDISSQNAYHSVTKVSGVTSRSSLMITFLVVFVASTKEVSGFLVEGFPEDPPMIPLQVLWIPFKFFSPKVFKSLFCSISVDSEFPST